MNRRTAYKLGLRTGLPIALGYFAVAFSLGITARMAGITAFQGILLSALNNASAGEYAGIVLIAANGSYAGIALITLITNARYLLMSTALSQKFKPDTPLIHRLLVGFDVTDEIFAATIARPGTVEPFYNYGIFSLAIPGWAIGTAVGILAGSILPGRIVSALGVALYGMFLASIIPEAKKNRIVTGIVAISFAASFAFSRVPALSGISSGTQVIILTVLIAGLAALLFPVKDGDASTGTDSDSTAEQNPKVSREV